MKLRSFLTATALAGAFVLGSASTSSAHEDFKNLEVLKDTGKDLEKGMKNLSKGLGVKCTACHVKGEFSSDDVAAKNVTREFFKKAIGAKKEAKQEALKPLLKALKLDKLKSADKFWKGVDKLEKK